MPAAVHAVIALRAALVLEGVQTRLTGAALGAEVGQWIVEAEPAAVALPTLGLILFLPLMWPLWLALWGFLVIKGFGGRPARTHTRAKSRSRSCK